MRVLFQICLCLYDKYSYTEVIMEMLEYYYELWTARAPASGFNRMEHGSTESSIHGTRTQDSIWSIAGRLVQKVWDLVMEVKNVMNQEGNVLPLPIFWLGKLGTDMPDGMPDNVRVW